LNRGNTRGERVNYYEEQEFEQVYAVIVLSGRCYQKLLHLKGGKKA